MLTYEQQEENRMDRLREVGTESECPFCNQPRVMRSDYLRCNPCGINWLFEELNLPNYLNRNPSAARTEAVRMARGIKPTAEQQGESAE